MIFFNKINLIMNDTHMYISNLFSYKADDPTSTEIIFSFFLTILIVYMISTLFLSFAKIEKVEK